VKIAILKERASGETRVAATPETAKKFAALGLTVAVEAGAGVIASITDDAYAEAGVTLGNAAATVKDADIVLGIQAPDVALLKGARPGAWVAALFDPFANRAVLDAYAAAGFEALSMEFMPRITRAQSMDVLSSQSNLAGYKAVLAAADVYGRAFPMMMTAAGTVPAARVFVMGAGVAGLQAIATARRLGAIVTATDVRPATEEQVASLGAKFIAVKNEEFEQAQTAGGYAKEMSDDYKKQQAELVAGHIAKQDIVITTALIPGRKAPILVTAAMVASMKPGSILVDLAVEQGGNVEGAEFDKVVETDNGVKIMGFANLPGRLAADASSLFARNHFNFLSPFVKDGALAFDEEDDLVKGVRLSKDGALVHPSLVSKG
jgi:NAD(P) transhydrogenase subunit alpha